MEALKYWKIEATRHWTGAQEIWPARDTQQWINLANEAESDYCEDNFEGGVAVTFEQAIEAVTRDLQAFKVIEVKD